MSDLLENAVLLKGCGQLYVGTERQNELPVVWNERGDSIATFMHRRDAEIFCALFNERLPATDGAQEHE